MATYLYWPLLELGHTAISQGSKLWGNAFQRETHYPMDITGLAPVFDNNRALFPELDEEQLAAPDWYIQHCRPKLGRDFIITARGLLTDDIRKDLEPLQDFRFANHPTLPIPETRLELLNAIVHRQLTQILA